MPSIRPAYATKQGKLTEDERTVVFEMGSRKVSAGIIARKLQRHPGTICYVMTMMGLREPTMRTFAYMRRGHPVRSFSPEEDRLIEHLAAEGRSYAVIGQVCGETFGYPRKAHSIQVRSSMVAGRAELRLEAGDAGGEA